MHPGLCGEQPDIAIESGTIVMRLSPPPDSRAGKEPDPPAGWSWPARTLRKAIIGAAAPSVHPQLERFPPASEVGLDVGVMIGTAIEQGDVLNIFRQSTGDWGLTVFRGGELQLAVGAVAAADLRGRAIVEEDPRAQEELLYRLKDTIAEARTRFVWVDASDPQRPRTLKNPSGSPPYRLVYAIAGQTREERNRANHALAGGPLPAGYSSCQYVDVDSRFADAEQWLAYVRSLPDERPSDLWIRLRIDDITTELREGEYAHVTPWHLYVERVYRFGMPGELSQLAIVKEMAGARREAVIEATKLVSSGRWRSTR
jgi:hypothetical protein